MKDGIAGKDLRPAGQSGRAVGAASFPHGTAKQIAADGSGSGARPATKTRVGLLYIAAICLLATVLGCQNPAGSVQHQYYLFVSSNDNTVLAFEIESDGTLSFIRSYPVSGATNLQDVAVSPNGDFLYVTDLNSVSISAFTIGPDGTLTANGTFSTGDPAGGLLGIAISPNGSHLYVANLAHCTISAFTIGPDGKLTPNGARSAPACPEGIAVSPNGNYLHGASDQNWCVFTCAIGSDGSLGSLDPTDCPDANALPAGVAVSPNGEYLYATDKDNDNIYAFTVAPDGKLTSNGTFLTGQNCKSIPGGLVVSPNGNCLYVTNLNSNNVSAFSIGPDGTLDLIDSYATGFWPQGVTISPNGAYLYVANGGASVSAFKIGSAGTLSPNGETIVDSTLPLGIAIATK